MLLNCTKHKTFRSKGIFNVEDGLGPVQRINQTDFLNFYVQDHKICLGFVHAQTPSFIRLQTLNRLIISLFRKCNVIFRRFHTYKDKVNAGLYNDVLTTKSNKIGT